MQSNKQYSDEGNHKAEAEWKPKPKAAIPPEMCEDTPGMDNDGLPLYPSEYENQAQIKKFNPKAQIPTPAVQQMPEPIMPAAPVVQLLGPENTVTTCQFCHASIKTAVKFTTTSRTHIAAALWGILCCLCCVPYGAESAKNSDHYCPNCQRYLGSYIK